MRYPQLPIGRHASFEVMGRRQYRGHEPGELFEARIDAAIERAVGRMDIRLIEYVEPGIPPGYWLPKDWPLLAADTKQTEAPQGASRIRGRR